MKKEIIPTVFATNKKEFYERLNKLIKISNHLQIDFMDGKFVKSKGISLEDVENLKRLGKVKFEAHLMVSDPEKWISGLKKKGFHKVIFHYGALDSDPARLKTIRKIKSLRMEAWIALNPEDNVKEVKKFLEEVDGVLFMGIIPGKEGQKFLPKVYEKIKELREFDKKIKIQVDGGADFQVVKQLGILGVDYVNSGSLVYKAENSKEVVKKLNGYLNV